MSLDRRSLVGLRCGQGGGNEDCAPFATPGHQLHDCPYIKPSPPCLHGAAGGATNTRLGRQHVYHAMLAIIPNMFQLLMIVGYDRLLEPFLRWRTGYEDGITHLQSVGVGFTLNIIAAVAPQFFLLGMTETTSFVGLLEFFNSEAPDSMKSIGVVLFWCQAGLFSLLGTLLVRLVNKVTRHHGGLGWLEGTNLNTTRLDLFYWVVAAVALLGWLNFLYSAKRYRYRHDPRIASKPVDEDSKA
ncbi:hypothetical protein ACP70R_003182 [Stipagrostis hirtigluma subsp. patula]